MAGGGENAKLATGSAALRLDVGRTANQPFLTLLGHWIDV